MPYSIQSFFKSRVLLHVAGWIIFFIAPILIAPPEEFANAFSNTSNFESIVIRNFILMALFYINLFYLAPIVLKKNGVRIFLLVLTTAIVVVSLLNWWIHHNLSEPYRPEYDPNWRLHYGLSQPVPGQVLPPTEDLNLTPPRPRPMLLASSLFTSFLITMIVVSISTSIVLWNDWVRARAEEQERAFQKLASELAVLKLQISPHFLFNTLNNIRWLVRSKSDQAEEAVMKLSHMLRYILYQTNQEKTTLMKEVENLQDYISLQQMRLKGHENLLFSFTGELDGKMIVPLLLVPIVENVFKYGDFNGTFQNKIQLDLRGDRLIFTTENLVLASASEVNKEESGIGLTNIKKRLLLHYPEKHVLNYFKKESIFKLELDLILN